MSKFFHPEDNKNESRLFSSEHLSISTSLKKGPFAHLGKTLWPMGGFCLAFFTCSWRADELPVIWSLALCYLQGSQLSQLPHSCSQGFAAAARLSWDVEGGLGKPLPGCRSHLACLNLSGVVILAAEGGRGEGRVPRRD